MEITHRISISDAAEVRRELAALGVHITPGALVIAFDITESDVRWPAVRSWVDKRQALDLISTKFTPQEIANAHWLWMIPSWHHGYPQPREQEFGYLQATYDLSKFCHSCGTGKVQRAPFQMKAEPKWGRREILQLNWVFGEFFVTPQLWKAVFEPAGIACREVFDRGERTLQTVVQLVIEEELDLALDEYEPMNCEVCGRAKYAPHVRGLFPPPNMQPKNNAFGSVQIFGSGASANRCILVSQSVSAALRDVSGVNFWPVANWQSSLTP